MNRKVIVYLLIIFIILGSFSLWAKSINAQGKEQDTNISAQLQRVLQNQQIILKKLDQMDKELKEELNVIKIRATVKGGATRP